MENFKTPKLLITDHYDSVISQVDILIDELLGKYNENDLLSEENNWSSARENLLSNSDDNYYNIEGYIDPYQTSEYKYDMSKMIQLMPNTNRMRDYLDLVRWKFIDELKKAEKENLSSYELNKLLYKYNRNDLTDEKVDEMCRNLFENKFCFLLQVKGANNCLSDNFLIITDFYLDKSDLKFLRGRYTPYAQLKDKSQLPDDESSIDVLDRRTLFLHLVDKYISGLAFNQKYGTEIISISKSSLKKINRLEILYSTQDQIYLTPEPSIIDFIKSLTLEAGIHLYAISRLSGLANLEYLRIKGIWLHPNSFVGLRKLIKLELIDCYGSNETDKRINFAPLCNLQILKIKNPSFPAELNCLESLQLLLLDDIDKPEYLLSLSESITILELTSIRTSNIKASDEFFSRLILPNLVNLNINYINMSNSKKEWFKGINKYLNEFVLKCCDLKSLDFLRFECFSFLEKLDISCDNFIDDRNGNKGNFRIEKEVFSGLKNLKELRINSRNLESIDPDAFSHTLKLSRLEINSDEFKFEEDKFAKLNHLKKIIVKKFKGF